MANQTVNLPSRMLILRLASCRVVLWALKTHGPRLMEILNGPACRALPTGIQPIFEQLVMQLQEMLGAARDNLIASDRNHRDQKAKASSYRRMRDDAFKALSPNVVGVRDTVLGACGTGVVEEVGFALRTPQQPGELHEQATHLVARLGNPELVLPAVRWKGVSLDPASMAEEMQPLVEQLGETLDDLSREERRADATKIAKDEALDAYDRTFLWVARSAESLFRLADLPEVAKRVRPSTRRPGLTKEVEDEGAGLEPEDPDATTEGDSPEASPEEPSDDSSVEE